VAALLKGDQQPLGEIFAEDWLLVDGAGQTHKRDEIFKSLSSGELKFFAYDLGDMDIRIVGDTAVVIGHGHPRGQIHGEMFEENEVFTDTFARINGKWRCVLSHSVDLPDEQK
jgi:ketosteroid isomerase-like protein